jgi:uncharacterized protein (TIGR02594 family)
MKIQTSCFDLAQRFIGMAEVPGTPANPAILAMLHLDVSWPEGDEVAWCSALTNYIAWLLRLPRSKSLRARSWLRVGQVIALADAVAENDVVILRRGADDSGPDVIEAPGHVGFYAGHRIVGGPGERSMIAVLGGNQGNSVSVAEFPVSRLLGVRRLA